MHIPTLYNLKCFVLIAWYCGFFLNALGSKQMSLLVPRPNVLTSFSRSRAIQEINKYLILLIITIKQRVLTSFCHLTYNGKVTGTLRTLQTIPLLCLSPTRAINRYQQTVKESWQNARCKLWLTSIPYKEREGRGGYEQYSSCGDWDRFQPRGSLVRQYNLVWQSPKIPSSWNWFCIHGISSSYVRLACELPQRFLFLTVKIFLFIQQFNDNILR